jgi:hypothetical protein
MKENGIRQIEWLDHPIAMRQVRMYSDNRLYDDIVNLRHDTTCVFSLILQPFPYGRDSSLVASVFVTGELGTSLIDSVVG